MTTKEMLFMGLVGALIAFCLFMGIRSSNKTHRATADETFLWGEMSNNQLPNVDRVLANAERDNKDCRWAEARGKKNDPYTLEIVCHRTAKPTFK